MGMTTGNKRSIVLNGKELTVVDFKRGDRTISQTTELPSGEHLTTTVEGTFGWAFQTCYMGNFHVDVKGENPWVGDYAMDRHVNWNLSRPEYIFNWVGKSEFKNGPFASFSPIDSKINFNYNSRQLMLNADMVETMGGKQYGVKIHRNRFSLLTGIAA